MLTPDELLRYQRQISLSELGTSGQLKLKHARVLVVGSGGLGSPLLLYLAAAGVGEIGIIDFDVVESSNLHRQVVFRSSDIGRSKAEAAAHHISQLNPNINLTVYHERLSEINAIELLRNYDVVADGSDNFPTRYLVNDVCVKLGKVNVYAGIYRYEGQVSVFNYPDTSGLRGPNYRDLFPETAASQVIPNCAETGVIGALPGIIGSIQAMEVIKVITGIGEVLSGRLLIFDAASALSRTVSILRNPSNPLNGKTSSHSDVEATSSATAHSTPEDLLAVKEISVNELREMMYNGTKFQLIDVREPEEFARFNLGGELMPLGDLHEYIPQIAKDRTVVVHCKAGVRSAHAIQFLQEEYGYTQLYNLQGGVLEWVRKFGYEIQGGRA